MIDIDKIYKIDCLDGLKQIPSNTIDLICTDPPYGINFIPQRESSKKRHGNVPVANDEIQGDLWVEWFLPICKDLYRVLKNDSVAYLFSGFNSYYYYYHVLNLCGFKIKANIIWVKNNFGIGYHFRRQYEQILVAFKGSPKTPKKAMSDVIFEDKIIGIELKHICQKPVKLIHKLICQYSNPGQLVLDPFMGSGTTAIACKDLNRHFIGFEVEQKYIDIANKRLNVLPDKLDRWV